VANDRAQSRSDERARQGTGGRG